MYYYTNTQIYQKSLNSDWIVPMSKYSNYKNFRPPIEYFLNKISSREYFSFCKLNHSFWEVLYDVKNNEHILENYLNIKHDDSFRAHFAIGWLKLHGLDLMHDLLNLIQTLKNRNLMFGAGNSGPVNEEFYLNSLPNEVRFDIMKKNIPDFIKSNLPENYIPFFGPIWKEYVINNTIYKLFNLINNKRIVLVGLPYLKHNTVLNKFEFIELSLKNATKNRFDLLNYFNSVQKEDDVWLFQAGDSLSTWFISQMNDNFKNAWLIDIGRAFDKFIPNQYLNLSEEDAKIIPDLKEQLWMKEYKNQIKFV